MKNSIIEFQDVRFCYGDVCAVRKVNIALEQGKLTALIGPNGGGKSTLIKLAGGFLKPDNGKIVLGENKTIGYVSQGFGFDESFPITVKEVVLTGTLNRKLKPFARYTKEQKEKAEEAIKQVGLQGFESRGVNQLSGGQLKRVVIARALASKADILVLDEPDSHLDIEVAKELYQLLSDLKGIKTILVASHNIDYILDIADSAVYVNKTTQTFDRPAELKEKLEEGMIL